MPDRELQEFHARERREAAAADILGSLVVFALFLPVFVGIALLFAKTFG